MGIYLLPVEVHLVVSWVSLVEEAGLREAGNDTNVKAGFMFKILPFYPDKIPCGTEWKSELCHVVQLIDLAENSPVGGIRKKLTHIFSPKLSHTFGYWEIPGYLNDNVS